MFGCSHILANPSWSCNTLNYMTMPISPRLSGSGLRWIGRITKVCLLHQGSAILLSYRTVEQPSTRWWLWQNIKYEVCQPQASWDLDWRLVSVIMLDTRACLMSPWPTVDGLLTIFHMCEQKSVLSFRWAHGQVCAIDHMTGASQHCRGMLITHECP
jgi:hypothetical protein